MVAHSSRFNVLAVFCSLAALSLSPLSASALAIQTRDSTLSSKHVLARSPGRQETFILSLPYDATKKSVSKKNKDKSASSTKGKPTSRRHYENGDLAHVKRRSSRSISPADAQAHVESESPKDGDSGRVDVMSPAQEGFKKIASLWIPEGTTALKASDTNYTKFHMVPVAGSRPASLEPSEHLVRVIADGVTTDGVSYCITTNTEKESSAMTAQACYNSDGNSTVSQLFAHNDNTGVVRPMQPVGKDINSEDGQHNSTADSTSPNNGSVEAAQSFFGERDIGGTDGAQNVTLMFVPATQAANAEDMPQVTVVTATSTMTTTYTITTSMTASVSAADVTPTSMVTSSDSTGTSTISAADVSPTSTVVSSSISPVTSSSTLPASTADPTSSFSFETSTITVVAAAASSTSESVSSSSSTVPSSVTSVPTLAALDVQVVAQATSSTGSNSVTVTSTSTSPMSSPTVNAEEIASKIAASFASVADVVSSTVISTTTDDATSTTSSAASSATSTSVPSLTPRDTEPYVWVYKARKE